MIAKLALLFLCFGAYANATSVVTSALVRDLLESEDVYVRPNADHGPVTTVTVGFDAYGFEEMKTREDAFTLHSFTFFQWNDPRLAWKPTDYDNVSRVFLPSDKIWLPDFTLFNNVDATTKTYTEDTKNVIALPNGDIFWVPPTSFSARCNSTAQDSGEISCGYYIGSWTYDSTDLDIKPQHDKIGMAYFQSERFKITTTSVVRTDQVYPGAPGVYPRLDVTLKARRTTSK